MRLLLAFVGIAALGCGSTVGPLVTDVQLGAGGALVVQRCYVRFDPWASAISTDRCDVRSLEVGRGGAR